MNAPKVEAPKEEIIEKPVSKPIETATILPKPAKKEPEEISLFDEPTNEIPEVKLSKDILVLKAAKTPEGFYINDDLMINIMVSSKKDIKNKFLDEWKKIKLLLAHPKLGKAAAMLLDSHTLVASQKVLIIESQLQSTVEKINQLDIQQDLQDVINSVFGVKCFIYAVSRNESVRLQKVYTDKFQVNALPKKETITLEFEGE